jgi:hypothetical protein
VPSMDRQPVAKRDAGHGGRAGRPHHPADGENQARKAG